MPTLAQMQADDDAWSKAYDDQKAQETAMASFSGVKPGEPIPPASPSAQWMQPLPSRVDTSLIDGAVSTADRIRTHFSQALDMVEAQHPGIRNVMTGALDAGLNLADTAHSVWTYVNGAQNQAEQTVGGGTPQPAARPATPRPMSQGGVQDVDDPPPDPHDPIYTAARGAVMDFRDALAVKNPSTWDDFEQQGAQFAIPFIGYSRLLGGLNGTSRVLAATKGLAADSLTAATALDPHGSRLADTIQLERHVQSKFGSLLRTIAPDGSLLNQYISWAADHSNESDFEGRVKNVVDQSTVAGLYGVAARVLKEGYMGTRFAIENGVATTGDLMRAAPNLEASSYSVNWTFGRHGFLRASPGGLPVAPAQYELAKQIDDVIREVSAGYDRDFLDKKMSYSEHRSSSEALVRAKTQMLRDHALKAASTAATNSLPTN